MITLVEPKQQLVKLWSKPIVKADKRYRLMKYVMRVNHRNRILLHNVITGQLVLLDQKEESLLDSLPITYSANLEELVSAHFLVTEQFDEHQQVLKMRDVLRKLNAARHKPIVAYTILPTTGCNARCYYCFEHGIKFVTMTEETADSVIDFITANCEGVEVHINWFGGEPTLAANRIDQICKGLHRNGIRFQSSMVTNGYLLDEEMVFKSKNLWNLYHVQISVDGTELTSNYIKDFVNVKENPYKRVFHNIGLLISNDIRVSLRMNFDVKNADEFGDLVNEVLERFQGTKLLDIYATPVLGAHKDKNGKVCHGDDKWLEGKIVELNDLARIANIAKSIQSLPFLRFTGCSAEDDSYTQIGPDGSLARCLELFGKGYDVGSVYDGITDANRYQSWKTIADYDKCINCIYFPYCVKMKNCPAGDRCYHLDRNLQMEASVCKELDMFFEREGVKHGVS